MIKAAIYARKSTLDERDEADGKSTARQVAQAREFAASKGWTVADVYVDENISGTIFDLTKRRGLGRMLDSLKQFDVVVTMEQSRLGRDIAKTLELITTIEAAGLEVWSYSDARRISVEEELGEMSATMTGIIDKAESRRASTRTSAGLVEKAKRGHVTGTLPYGYSSVRVGPERGAKNAKDGHSEYRINEAEADVVRRIFALSIEGYGGRRIANILNADAVPAPGKLRKNGKGETLRSALWSKFTIKANSPASPLQRRARVRQDALEGQAAGQAGEGREAARGSGVGPSHRHARAVGGSLGEPREGASRVHSRDERPAALEA